jgi:hypothetical protein
MNQMMWMLMQQMDFIRANWAGLPAGPLPTPPKETRSIGTNTSECEFRSVAVETSTCWLTTEEINDTHYTLATGEIAAPGSDPEESLPEEMNHYVPVIVRDIPPSPQIPRSESEEGMPSRNHSKDASPDDSFPQPSALDPTPPTWKQAPRNTYSVHPGAREPEDTPPKSYAISEMIATQVRSGEDRFIFEPDDPVSSELNPGMTGLHLSDSPAPHYGGMASPPQPSRATTKTHFASPIPQYPSPKRGRSSRLQSSIANVPPSLVSKLKPQSASWEPLDDALDEDWNDTTILDADYSIATLDYLKRHQLL